MNEKIHQQVRSWLASDDPLDTETEKIVQEHLHSCPECRSYANMMHDLQAGSWNPYPRQRLSRAKTTKIVQELRPQLRRNKMKLNVNTLNLSSALGAMGLVAIIGLFVLALSRLNQTAVPSLYTTGIENYTQYDGWESGVAFQFPDTWTITEFVKDNGLLIPFATPLNETAAPCTPFMPADANAAVWIMPIDQAYGATPLELINNFVQFEEAAVQEPIQAVTVDGRSAAYSRGEIPCEAPFNQLSTMTASIDTHLVFMQMRHSAADAEAARANLETIIATLTPVDYSSWQAWRPSDFNFAVLTPADWYVFDTLKALQLTTSSQPTWSSYADPNQPVNPNPVTMHLFHNLNRQSGGTSQDVVAQQVAQMETELTMQQVEPPTAHPFIPGLVTAVYTTEDTAVFFGALAYPRNTVSLDPVGAMATVPLDQLDSFGTTFERVLRSLNGYYVAGIPIRDTIRGSEYMPTPFESATVNPEWTPTPLPPTTPPDQLFITPTPAEFSRPGWTPTPFPPTTTPIPQPTEP